MADQILVLLLEDDDVDAELITRALARAMPGVQVDHARTSKEYLERLAGGHFDAIVSDSSVMGCEGVASFHLARERHPGVPFIFLSGAEDRNRDLRGLQALGVSSVLTKAQLPELSPLLARSIEERRSGVEAGMLEGYERLVENIKQLSLARDLPAVMAIVRRAARVLAGADGATFVLRDGDLCHYADEDAIGPLWKGKKFPIESCISGWCMANRQPAVVEDIFSDPRIPLATYEPTFVRSLVIVPIRAIDPVGAIGAYWSRKRLARPHEVRLLQALADSTTVAMENVRVYETLEARVRERTAELEAITYAVSHDLRAPIRHASGHAAIMLEDHGGEFSAAARERLGRITDAVARMGRMVEGLLDVSRMQRAPLRREQLDLAALAREIAAHCQSSAQRPVDFSAPASLPAAGDPALLRSALENLLGNAWKFSSKQQAPRVELGVQLDPQSEPVYFVRDNGAGFDEQHAGKLFGLFQRLHDESEFPGTGLGLASVQRIIEKHSGSIWASATPGQGATFYFTLGPSVKQG